SGSREGLPQLPDGEFQPPMPLNCGEALIAGRLENLFDGRRRMIPGRVANLTQPLPGRSPCQYRDACWLGCPYGAYFSTQSSTFVTEVGFGRDRRRGTGVQVLDAVSGSVTEYRARIIFLCASTLNTTRILMGSASVAWLGGLGSSSC